MTPIWNQTIRTEVVLAAITKYENRSLQINIVSIMRIFRAFCLRLNHFLVKHAQTSIKCKSEQSDYAALISRNARIGKKHFSILYDD